MLTTPFEYTSVEAQNSPALAETRDLSGFQPKRWDPGVLAASSNSVCARGQKLYFSNQGFIYALDLAAKDTSQALVLYAGSEHENNTENFNHRFRLRMGAELYLACTAKFLYVSDKQNNRILRLTDDGEVKEIAKDLADPKGLDVDSEGNVYVAEYGSHTIRKIAADGSRVIVAGSKDQAGFAGDGGAATAAKLNKPMDVVIRDKVIYIAEYSNACVRKVSTDGTISTFVGPASGNPEITGSIVPMALSVGASNELFIAHKYNRIYRVANAAMNLYAGNGQVTPAENVDPSASGMNVPMGMARISGVLYLADFRNALIRVIAKDASGTPRINTLVGHNLSQEPTSITDKLDDIKSVAIAPNGDIVFSQPVGGGYKLRRVVGETIVSAEGSASPLAVGDLKALTPDADGGFYFIDDCVVKKIDGEGSITRVAGDEDLACGSGGDGQPATSAGVRLNAPEALALTPDGILYIADTLNDRIRKISTDGVITTLDPDGDGRNMGLDKPAGVFWDQRSQGLYIADKKHDRILHYKNGSAPELVINGTFTQPTHLVADPSGLLYVVAIVDGQNPTAVRLTPEDSGEYRVEPFFEAKDDADCGSLHRRTPSENMQAAINVICPQRARALAIQDTCSQDDGTVRLVIDQGIWTDSLSVSNIVEIFSPCP